MLDLAMLAQWPRSPSAILGLSSDLSDAQCFDFDRAVLRYWRWYEAKANETIWVSETKAPRGKVRGPKYRNDADILRLYYGKSTIDPVVAAITPDEWENDLNDFSDMLLGRSEETLPEA